MTTGKKKVLITGASGLIGGLGFPAKAKEIFRLERLEEFEGHPSAQIGVPCLPDFAHPSGPQLGDSDILPEAVLLP